MAGSRAAMSQLRRTGEGPGESGVEAVAERLREVLLGDACLKPGCRMPGAAGLEQSTRQQSLRSSLATCGMPVWRANTTPICPDNSRTGSAGRCAVRC